MITSVRTRFFALGAFVLGAALAPPLLHAQGVTTAAVSGAVTDTTGQPVSNAQVQVVNNSNGYTAGVITGTTGRYFVSGLEVGGPYTITVRRIGFQPSTRSGLTLSLGQNLRLDFKLLTRAVQLSRVVVNGAANPLINTSRTGPATTISDSAITRLPLLGRNFTDLIETNPQVVGTSVGGQNNRFNNIQIDGAVNNDLFGLGDTGTPGSQANAKPISLEAVKEFQVLIAPYDVRQGSFTGGLINAVTKSGTNHFHGSVFEYLQNQHLVGHDYQGQPIGTFSTNQYGFSLGGPIIQNRVHFFVAGDFQASTRPFSGPQIGTNPAGGADSAGVGITDSSATRFQSILKNQYGLDAGGFGPISLNNPNPEIFAKVDAQLGPNSRLTISHNWVHATSGTISRDQNYYYAMSSGGYEYMDTQHATRATWNLNFGNRFSNELVAGYQTIDDPRQPNSSYTLIDVHADQGILTAGAERYSQQNLLTQKVFELTDNFGISLGSHQLTFGTHNEFFKFHNVFFPQSYGEWTFDNLDSLQAGHASQFQIGVPLRPGGPTADFSVRQLGVYAEDQWSATPHLTITAGLRLDDPILPTKPAFNSAAQAALGINTAAPPSGNLLWSPRIGFNYDVNGDATTIIRGGTGLFAGRPAYVWLSDAYSNTGSEQALLTCRGADVPAFVTNIANQPTSCAGGGAATPPIPVLNYFDPNFKFPQVWKSSIGIDHQLPYGIVASADFLFTKATNQLYIQDTNLQGVIGYAAGEGNRPMYGTIDSTGRATTARLNNNFGPALEHLNKSADRSYSATIQLRKSFSNGLEFDGGYTYSNSKDLFSLTSSIAVSNYGYEPLYGTIANRTLSPSSFDTPSKITLSGTANIPFGIRASLIYLGFSGMPYAYVVNGDVNGDGMPGPFAGGRTNDLVYVPKDSTDIELRNPADWSRLNAYINSEPCLNSQRGRIMARNSCRNSWSNFLDARLGKVFPTVHGQSLEITADIFNLLNMLNNSWGQVRETSAFNGATLLRMVGYDNTLQRGIYTTSIPTQNRIQLNSSRWRIQLGAKYTF